MVKRIAHSPDVIGIQVFDPPTNQFHPRTSLEDYKVSDIDETGATCYYGFLSISGAWYIMEVTATTVRYFAGTTGYGTAWTGRALIEYGLFDVVF